VREFVYFVTASLDGFIARPGGEIDWLLQGDKNEDFGFANFMQSIDTVVQGRKTYEQVLTFGDFPYPDHKNYVFSRKLMRAEHAEVVRMSVPEFVHIVRRQPGKDIWIVGGGDLAAAFFHAGAIDRLIVFVQPILLGTGLPLTQHIGCDIRLNLEHSRPHLQGLVELSYRVSR